jgi:hypothetical protein
MLGMRYDFKEDLAFSEDTEWFYETRYSRLF